MNLAAAASELSEFQRARLVAAARAAVAKAFLTKEGGVRYGAAVMTRDGRIFSSGQYSSFNHCSNVHAEQAALVLATMHGEPDILGLAVASTSKDPVTRPCGVCRQVMLEHATRINRDFPVLMADATGAWEEATVSSLLPHAWTAGSQISATGSAGGDPTRAVIPHPPTCFREGAELQTGDHVLLRNGLLALVWDPRPWEGDILVKLKYQPEAGGRWRKFAHAFTGGLAYERQLAATGGTRPAPCGAPVACVSREDITEVFPCQPAGVLPPVFAACLERAGIAPGTVWQSGSRSTGMAVDGSDSDWVVRAGPESQWALRQALADELRAGTLRVPESSATWRLLRTLYPGGQEAILREGRFAETFMDGAHQQVVMGCSVTAEPPAHGAGAVFGGHLAETGTVRDVSGALGKRAMFTLDTAAGGSCVVVSYHKAANMVRAGDGVAVRGWEARDGDRRLLLQFHPHRDNIVWFPQPQA